jgi:hypothetical protein
MIDLVCMEIFSMSEAYPERDHCLHWEAGSALALEAARDAVEAMRQVSREFAQDDPYETGHRDLAVGDEDLDGVVDGLALQFTLILNSHGLLKIDP